MQQPYRATRWLTPKKDETIVRSKEQAEKLIADLETKLVRNKYTKLSKSCQAHFLNARAGLYAAIGSPKMLEAAEDACKFGRSANTFALMAMALHHFGRIREANEFYKKAYQEPHEPGWEIDLSYAQSLMSQGQFREAWPIVKTLKKRMVYAAYLPNWDGKPCKELSVISEGGFGDIIHMSRYLPLCQKICGRVTVYLPPFFFEHGFVDLARRQSWWPKTKLLTETPPRIPAVGFFDFPAVFETTPEMIPPSPVWCAENRPANLRSGMNIGFCYAARAMETPIVPDGVYRSLTVSQALKIVNSVRNVNWISLQKGETFSAIQNPALKSWEDTAAIIANLDAVVSVDTAVAHLAAAMGKPVFVLLSGASDWKYGLTDTVCKWYPTMKIIHNNDFGFENSVNEIISLLNYEQFNHDYKCSPRRQASS